MRTSDQASTLYGALAKFQLAIEDAPKTSQAHNYKFATLGSILEMARPILAEHGLAVIQTVGSEAPGVISVTSRLAHVSGEYVEDTISLEVEQSRGMSRAQSAGSTITYLRRYAYATILGIAQVDDDAAIAKKVEPPFSGPDGSSDLGL